MSKLLDWIKKIFQIEIKEHTKVALLNSGFSIFFNLLPFWAGLLIISSLGQWKGWMTFYGSGEFYLYSTSLISSAYLIYHNNKVKTSDLNSFFSIVSLILIVVISILYATISVTQEKPEQLFIKWASILAISMAIPLFYYSQIVSNKKSPNIGNKRREEQGTIIDGIS